MSLLGRDTAPPHRGTLTPLVPLSRHGRTPRRIYDIFDLRAIKGEGEIRLEVHVCALHARGPLVQYWGEGDGFPIGVGNDGKGEGWDDWTGDGW